MICPEEYKCKFDSRGLQFQNLVEIRSKFGRSPKTHVFLASGLKFDRRVPPKKLVPVAKTWLEMPRPNLFLAPGAKIWSVRPTKIFGPKLNHTT